MNSTPAISKIWRAFADCFSKTLTLDLKCANWVGMHSEMRGNSAIPNLVQRRILRAAKNCAA
jgi:hypothetical protein